MSDGSADGEREATERGIRVEEHERHLELLVAHLLRVGVLLAAAIVVAGGALFLHRHARDAVSYGVFTAEPKELTSVGGIIGALGSLRGRSIIQFGLVLLIATPIARVALSMIGFVKERDWLYVGMTAVVLSFLAYGLLLG